MSYASHSRSRFRECVPAWVLQWHVLKMYVWLCAHVSTFAVWRGTTAPSGHSPNISCGRGRREPRQSVITERFIKRPHSTWVCIWKCTVYSRRARQPRTRCACPTWLDGKLNFHFIYARGMGAPSSNPSIVRSPEKGAAGCIYWYVHAGRRRQTLFVSGAHRWFSIVNIVWWWMCACECTRFHWCARVCLICVCLQAVSVCVCINPSNNPNEYTNVRTHRSNNIWQTYTSRHTPTEQKKPEQYTCK